MKKFVAMLMALALLCTSIGAFAMEDVQPLDNPTSAPIEADDGYEGDVDTSAWSDSHKMSWENTKNKVEPTCTEPGHRYFQCQDCGVKFEVESPANGHADKTPAVTEITTQPTCTQKGVLTHYGCANCKVETWTTEIDMLKHDYVEETVSEATCGKNKVIRRTCKNCDLDETVEVANTALQHNKGQDLHHIDQLPSCSEKGKVGDAFVCTNCGAVLPEYWNNVSYIDEADHLAELKKIIMISRAPIGTATGDKQKYVATLWYKDRTNNDASTQLKAGTNTIEAYEYDDAKYGEVTVEFTPNTCTENGKIVATCEDCGKALEISLDDEEVFANEAYLEAHGHEDGEIEPEQNIKDCTKMTSALYKCSICGETYNKPHIPAKDHNFKKDENVLRYEQQKFSDTKAEVYAENEIAKCHDYVQVVRCANVGCEVEHKFQIAGTDEHRAVTYIINRAPTCTEPGLKIYNCADCGYYQVEQEAATGHHFTVKGKVITEPTCTEDGVRELKCRDCDATSTEPIPALGHNYKTVTTQPDCLHGVVGRTVKTCLRCGHEEITDVKDGHEYDDADIKAHKPATCTEDGSISFICKHCHKLITKTLPATGHSFDAKDFEHTQCTDACTPWTCKGGVMHGTIHSVKCTKCDAVKTWEDEEDKPEGHTMFAGNDTVKNFAIQTLPTCQKAGKATYECARCHDIVEMELAPIAHNLTVQFHKETGAYRMECKKLESDNVEALKKLLKAAGYEDKVAAAVADQMSKTAGEYFAGIGCDHHEDIEIRESKYTATKASDTLGKIELVQGEAIENPYVRVTWRYTLANGDTVSFTTCRDVRKDGTFKIVGLSTPAGATCNFIYVEVVTDPDADLLYAGDYHTYGATTL